ncbi:MAG: hypothetical protein ACR2KL_10970 [Nocardioidaceae bacterium]
MTAVVSAPPPVRPREPLRVAEVEAMVSALAAAGCDTGPRVDRLFDAHAAILTACDGAARHLGPGLIDLDTDELAERVRAATVDVLARDAASGVGDVFLNTLACDAAGALADEATHFIADTLRPRFEAAVAVVRQAAAAGVTATTDAASIVQQGDATTLTVYRQLPGAVKVLDDLAELRDWLTSQCGVGPAAYPAAAYLAVGATLAELDGFSDHDDETQLVAFTDPVWHGAGFREEVVHRCGGRWLAMVADGLELRLNDGAEAAAVVAGAVAARVAERLAAEPEADDAAAAAEAASEHEAS